MSLSRVLVLATAALLLVAVGFAASQAYGSMAGEKTTFRVASFSQVQFKPTVDWSQTVMNNGCVAYQHNGVFAEFDVQFVGSGTLQKFSLTGTGASGMQAQTVLICDQIVHIPMRQAEAGTNSGSTAPRK